jgi:AcrR family transcriptional regulator
MKKETPKEKKEIIIQHIEEKLVYKKSYNICLATVAKELKISKRTIYEIFCSKDEIFEIIITRNNDKMNKIIKKIIDDLKSDEINVYTAIEEFLKLIFDYKHYPQSKIFDKFPKLHEKFRNEKKEFVETLFEIAKRKKVLKDDFNKRTFYIILGAVAHTIVMKPGIDLEIISEINAMLCRGIFSSQTQESMISVF